MYFEILLRSGLLGALFAIAVNQRWMLLGWAAIVLPCHVLQVRAPHLLEDEAARDVFSSSVILQCVLTITMAAATHHIGMYFIAAGLAANTLVIFANGSRMPINGGWAVNSCYCEADEHTHLVYFCDILQTTEKSGKMCVISPGDALECVGIWVLMAEIWLARLL